MPPLALIRPAALVADGIARGIRRGAGCGIVDGALESSAGRGDLSAGQRRAALGIVARRPSGVSAERENLRQDAPAR